MIPVTRPTTDAATRARVQKVIASGWWGYGPLCQELEARFTQRGGWALALQSCTASLWIAASLLRETGRTEAIIPAITYAGCAAALRTAGWTLRFADVDPVTGLIDLGAAKRLISPETGLLLIVDIYGQQAQATQARSLCDSLGIALVQDMAHRIDLWDDQPSLADFACYSFGPTKEAPSPEGGLVWSRHPQSEARARSLSLVGLDLDTWRRTRVHRHLPVQLDPRLGLKLRQNDVAAAFVLGGLERVLEQRHRRHAAYRRYRLAEAGTGLRLPQRHADDSYLMPFALIEADRRACLRDALARAGIGTSDHYPSLAEALDSADPCPNASLFAAEVFTLPAPPRISRLQADVVLAQLQQAGR
jgi:dTDP-4-amino-4,6-dideoxygalactose transaminase